MTSIFGALNLTDAIIILSAFTIQFAYLWACYGFRRVFGLLASVSLLAGASATLVAGGVNLAVLTFTGMSDSNEAVLVAPTVEECLKFGCLVIAINVILPGKNQPVRNSSATLMGLGTGSVFMLMERLTKASTGNLGILLTVLEEVPLHSVSTAFSTYSLSKGKPTKRLVLFLPIAILIHTAFNYSLSISPSVFAAVLLLYGELFVYWGAFFILGFRSRWRALPPAEAQ